MTTQSSNFLQDKTSAVGARIAAMDWSETPLGPIEAWPVSLRTTLATMLACPAPMFLAWGPQLTSFYNDAYAPILGYRAPTALGRPFRDLWSSLWSDIAPLVEATLAGESQSVTDMRLDLSRDNEPEESYWTFSYSPAFDDEGDVAGLLCVTNETTARVLSDRERQHADERLQLALSVGNSIGAWDWDVANDRITADVRFATLYGVDPERAAAGAPLAEFFEGIHPDDRERVGAEIEKVLESSGSFSSEYRLLRADGTVRWVAAQGRCIPDETGRCIRFPGVSFDITDRMNADIALRAAKAEREFVIDLTARQRTLGDPDAILRLSSETIGRRLGVNRVGFYRVMGSERLRHNGVWSDGTLSALIGEQATDAFGPLAETQRRLGNTLIFGDSRSDARGQLRPYADDGVLAGICVPLTDDGRWVAGIYLHQAAVRRWTDAEIALAKEVVNLTWLAVERAEALIRLEQRIDRQDAELMQGATALRDQTARRDVAETQVRQLQKMEAVGQLTGGIAHDFNNMLAVVISGLNLAQRRLARGDTDVGQFMTGALEGAQRAASLTQRLLAFSRQQPLSPEPTDANRLVSGLTDLLARTLGDDVAVETVLAAGLWKAKVDPNQLENAIVNLAVNGRDAMDGGGRITIETANAHVDDDYAREAEIEIGQYVLIGITDTGTGMSPEVIAKAFDPFFTTKGVGKGTGLGLSQVYGFIRQSGGHIRIYSEVGHGTTVKLYLPRSFGEAERVPLRQATSVRGGSPDEVILVVEDEERVRKFTVEALRELGYTVIHAANGLEALAILERGQDVTLLFTDIVMPEMTGRQLVDKALPMRPDMKVLYTTGYTRNAVVHNGILDPGTNLLPKPYGIDQMAVKVREVLDS